MKKSLIKTILIALLLVVMSINLTILQFSIVLNKTLLNPSYYDNIFQEQHFYDQVRQWILQRIITELPHGREGLVYFEKGLTDIWLRQEFMHIIDQLYAFLNGKTEELPTLRIYKFKEAVLDYMYGYGDVQNREKIIDFWLGPLPHVVRLQDVTSIAFLHDARFVITVLNSVFHISLILVLTFYILLFLLTRRLREAFLWFGASIFAAGLFSLSIAFFIELFINSVTALQTLQTSIVSQGFLHDNVRALFSSFTKTIISTLNTVSFFSTLIGLLSIYFVPIET